MNVGRVNGINFKGNPLSDAIKKNRISPQIMMLQTIQPEQKKEIMPDKQNEKSKKLWAYLGAAGVLVASGIYLIKRGRGTKPIENPVSSETLNNTANEIKTTISEEIITPVSEYLSELAKGLEKMSGKKIEPQNLSSVMNKEEFIEATSKLKKENYIASKENIENGIFKADLHSHSNYSDGEGTVENILNEVVAYADKLHEKTGDKFIFALTDHDTTEGSKEALKLISQSPEKFKNVRFVIGSEVSYLIKSDKTTNPCETSELLVFGFNPFAKKVEAFFNDVLQRRLDAQKNYIKDLSEKFPNTKFSEEEFVNVFLGDRLPNKPMMNSFWQIYHYGQIKDVLSNTAKAKGLEPENYFKECMAKAPKRLNLEEFKKHGLIENWITENPQIRTINDKYLPKIDGKGNIIKTSENLIDDIADAFREEKNCTIGFAHPYYISERTSNITSVIDEVQFKLGDLLRFTESYHQAYSPELLKNEGQKIGEISKLFEREHIIPIGGRDNHTADFLKL